MNVKKTKSSKKIVLKITMSMTSVEPWNPDNGHTAANPQHTRVPGGSGRPGTGRGALITQQYENA